MSFLNIDNQYLELCPDLELNSCVYVEPDDLPMLSNICKNDLSVMQLNVRGLLNKQYLLKEILLTTKPDVVLLCETWLTAHTETLLDIPGYKCSHKIRKDRIGGGVSVLVKANLRSRQREDLCVETTHLEHIVVELKTDTRNIIFVSGYRPPNTNLRQFLEEYKRLYRAVSKGSKYETIIGMDHNINLLQSLTHGLTNEFLEFNLRKNMIPCVTKPTRITHKTATLLDNIFISSKLQSNWNCKLLVDDISDHLPCLVILKNQNKSIKGSSKIEFRTLDEIATRTIKQLLDQNIWDTELGNLETEDCFNKFHDILLETIDKVAPIKIKTVSHKKLIRDPWITTGLMTSLTKQRRLYRAQLGCGNTVPAHKYKEYRNLLKKLVRKSKQEYLRSKCEEYKQNGKKLWQLINRVIGKTSNKKHIINSLRIDGTVQQDSTAISAELCSFFSSVGENYANKINSDPYEINNVLNKIPNNTRSMFSKPTSRQEIEQLIQKLPCKNSSGHDDISNNLLKKLNTSISLPLEIVFNKSIEEGIFPSRMKLADVVPLHKGKDPLESTNYRPISLLLTISKLLEKIMYQQTYDFLEQTGQIYPSQYGFRTAHSCEQAISELVSEILKGKEEGMYTLGLFLDLSKAFDTIEHSVLLQKLCKYGVRGPTLSWFRSYLENRKMRIKCETASSDKLVYSDYKTVQYGTPQGSCLGPLIFLIFTNDLHRHLHHCSSILFADDTTLYKTHRNLVYLRWCLEDEMSTISKWFSTNKLTLNIDKTVCVLFQKNNKTEKVELQVNDATILSQPNTKFLGMWLDQHLNWNKHIDILLLKITRNQNMLKLSRNFLPKDTKRLIYHSHIGSHIQYGLLLWGNGTQKQLIDKVQKIQDKCIKYITNRPANTQEYKDLKILKIRELILLANYNFGYKLQKGLLPPITKSICLADSKRKSLIKTHKYSTRNRNVPNLPLKASSKYLNSFLCKGPSSILGLPTEIKSKQNLQTFRSACKKILLSKY